MEHSFFLQPMPSNTGHQFSQVPQAEIERSSFDRSHSYKSTFDSGWLVPFFLDEVYPGDTFDLDSQILARLNTPIKPLMDNMKLSTFFFFVPYRILQTHWVNLMGEQDDPADTIDYAEPLMPMGDGSHAGVGTLWDYFGFPTPDQVTTPANVFVSAFPFRAYNLIYNRWFRDQNLQNSVHVDYDDSNGSLANYSLLRRGKRHDYFTSCLPWPQKGNDVTTPIGVSAPLVFPNPISLVYDPGSGMSYPIDITVSTDALAAQGFGGGGAAGVDLLMPGGGYADLSSATAATINQLRLAFQTQKLLERSARGGTRYPEMIAAQFGVTSPDFRFQWPEYLGGGVTLVNTIPVPQTAPFNSASSPSNTYQGNLAAVSAAASQGHHGHGFTHSFTEHGLVIGLMCVDADLTYAQGIERIWRGGRTRYDFYSPVFAHIGEQAVLSQEIYVDGSTNPSTGDPSVFGYQEAWAEYRYKPSRLTGLMRPQASGTLAVWNLSQDFSSRPTLNDDFIQSQPPVDRVVYVPSEPHFNLDVWFNLRCTRPMPTYSVPGLIDHF